MPRLPKGMFRRGPSWYVRLRQGGQSRWICLGPDFEDAKRKLRDIRRGDPVVGAARFTVAEASSRWLESYVSTARNAKGRKLAETRTARYLIKFLGYKPVGKVTPEDLRAYRLWLERRTVRGRALSVTSVWHLLSDARCFFRWCEDSGLIDRSPVPRRLLPRLQEQPPDRLSTEEVERLMGLPEPYLFVVRLALATGLRWGELCRAQASHLENGALVVSQTKSGKVRRVPLPVELAAEIRRRVGRLVPFAEGSPGSFSKAVRRLTGLGAFHVHQLRHTMACRWLERSGSLAALQQVLGHASITTTQRYARIADDLVAREAARIEALGA